MARLPVPQSDQGVWGDVLNDYLSQAHASDGTLKANSVNNAAITNGVVSEAKLDSAAQTKLNAIGGTIPDGSITKAKLVAGVQTTLDKADTATQPIDTPRVIKYVGSWPARPADTRTTIFVGGSSAPAGANLQAGDTWIPA